jgi:hypothetical protein
MLADVLSTLNNIPIQTAKANEELGCHAMYKTMGSEQFSSELW